MQTEIEVTLMDPNLDIEQAKDQLKSNLEELAGLTSLTESLLSLARLQNNHLDKSNLKLHTLVNSAISRAKPQAAMKSVKVKLSSPKNVLVCADRASLEEAVIIMIDNAIKYSPEKGQVDITIAKDTKSVKISVKDSGPGISDADLPHIFDRFYRSDTARTKNENNGYGLGLSIAKKIVDLHDGKIFVDSKLGEGSTFTICIPWQKYTS
jgi:signal transduction histidine kinase